MDIQLRKYLQSIKGIEQLQENAKELNESMTFVFGTSGQASKFAKQADRSGIALVQDEYKSNFGDYMVKLARAGFTMTKAGEVSPSHERLLDMMKKHGGRLDRTNEGPKIERFFTEGVQLDEEREEGTLLFRFDRESDVVAFRNESLKKYGISGSSYSAGSMYKILLSGNVNSIKSYGPKILQLAKKYGGEYRGTNLEGDKKFEKMMSEDTQLGEAETPFSRKISSAQDKLRKAGIKSAFQFGEIYVENNDLKKAERLVGGDKEVIVLGVPSLRPDEIDEMKITPKTMAFSLGRKAQMSGKKREPIKDNRLKALLKTVDDPDERNAMNKEWLRGWDEENLKEDVQLDEEYIKARIDFGMKSPGGGRKPLYQVYDELRDAKKKNMYDSHKETPGSEGGRPDMFDMTFSSRRQFNRFERAHDVVVVDVLDEETQHTVHVNVSRTGFRTLEAMIASLDGYKESDYSDGKARFYFDAKKHDSAERKKVAEFIKKTRGAEFSHAMKEDVQLDERTYNIGPVTTYMFLEEALHDPEMTFIDFLNQANRGDKATRRLRDFFNRVDYMVLDEMMDNLRLFAEKAKSGDAYFVYRRHLKDTGESRGFQSATMPFRGNPLGIKKLGDIAVGDDVTRELPSHMDYKYNRFVDPEDPREYNYTAMCVMIKD